MPQAVPKGKGSDGSFGSYIDSDPEQLATSFFTSQKTVATAGQKVQLIPRQPTIKVFIKANPANTGNIFVNHEGVSSTEGYILDAGQELVMEINLENFREGIFIDAETSGEGVSFLVLRR